MKSDPPSPVEDLARRGIRLLAAVVVALLAAAVAAAADGTPGLPLGVGAALTLGGLLAWWRSSHPAPLATSAVVAGAILVVLGLRSTLLPTGDELDAFLLAAGGGFLAAGMALDERRLVSLGLLQWALVLVRPDSEAVPFRHCLVATDLALPVPQLDGLLLLGTLAVVVGSVHRYAAWRTEAGRGAEATGLALVHGGLLAKAVELPDLEILCGAGRGIDVGWVVLGVIVAAVSAMYGLAGRDAVWAGVGVGALAAQGFVATVLSGEATWALLALAPLTAGLWSAQRAGIRWPRTPGYGRRRPWRRS